MKFPFFRNRKQNKLTIQLLGSSDIGLKRSQNQDSFFVTTPANDTGHFEALLIVADGMGGLAASGSSMFSSASSAEASLNRATWICLAIFLTFAVILSAGWLK